MKKRYNKPILKIKEIIIFHFLQFKNNRAESSSYIGVIKTTNKNQPKPDSKKLLLNISNEGILLISNLLKMKDAGNTVIKEIITSSSKSLKVILSFCWNLMPSILFNRGLTQNCINSFI